MQQTITFDTLNDARKAADLLAAHAKPGVAFTDPHHDGKRWQIVITYADNVWDRVADRLRELDLIR